MRPLWPRLAGVDLALMGTLGLLTLAASYAGVKMGASIGVGVALAVVFFVGTLVAFLRRPHLAIAFTVVLFPLVPALKVIFTSQIGPIKDVVCLAAFAAALLIFLHRRPHIDRKLAGLVFLLLALYVIDARGGHGAAWAQGVRLMGEPLLLLLVGLTLPEPRRNLRYALISLVCVSVVIALYGLLQQLLGPARLVSLGYQYNVQVRTIGGLLRSFGTLDDPFAYAAFLLFGLTAIIFWMRRGTFAWAAALILVAGLGASFVRTAVLVAVGLVGLRLWRWRRPQVAVLFIAATVIVAALTLTKAGGTEAIPYTVYTPNGGSQSLIRPVQPSSVVLNGRVSAWQAAVGKDPMQWIFGRGVGTVGTAAERATYTLAPSTSSSSSSSAGGKNQTQAVDSGYFATLADVGILGLLVLLALLARLAHLGGELGRKGASEGWLALGLLICVMLDALTRASFTGFPTAFVGLLLIGLAIASGTDRVSLGSLSLATEPSAQLRRALAARDRRLALSGPRPR